MFVDIYSCVFQQFDLQKTDNKSTSVFHHQRPRLSHQTCTKIQNLKENSNLKSLTSFNTFVSIRYLTVWNQIFNKNAPSESFPLALIFYAWKRTRDKENKNSEFTFLVDWKKKTFHCFMRWMYVETLHWIHRESNIITKMLTIKILTKSISMCNPCVKEPKRKTNSWSTIITKIKFLRTKANWHFETERNLFFLVKQIDCFGLHVLIELESERKIIWNHSPRRRNSYILLICAELKALTSLDQKYVMKTISVMKYFKQCLYQGFENVDLRSGIPKNQN